MNTFDSIDNKNPGEDDRIHTELYYEQVASEEEMYLEEREERARAVLISESSSPSGLKPDTGSLEENSSLPATNTRLGEESGATEVEHATQELITGDSDDPPLSEEAVAEMLRRTQNS